MTKKSTVLSVNGLEIGKNFHCYFNYILGAKCLLKGAQAVSLSLVF